MGIKMNRHQFNEWINNNIVYLDGATGTNLMKAGMPKGVCPEEWIFNNPEAIIKLQKDYVSAGSNIVYAPTFTANRIKLEEYGLESRIAELNEGLVKLSKEAVGGKALVAGDITMTGRQLYPIGTLMFEELVDVYKEQVRLLADAGADLIVIETMMSLQETRAAVLAVKETCELPVIVTLSFQENNRTLFGTDAKTAALVLSGLGVDAVGVNCSTGPDKMLPIVRDMRSVVNIPIIAKPNAGLPVINEDGETVYSLDADKFAEQMEALVLSGATILGGCCGTSPKYIKALKERFTDFSIKAAAVNKEEKYYITSERHTLEFGLDGRFLSIGERINPTGKKQLQEELRSGSLETVLRMAEEQEECGADILDVNLGMSGIDEKEMMLRVVTELTQATNLPLSIDSSHVDVIEAALRIYPGRALINSISLEKGKAERLMPLAKKYGAAFILLPLSDEGLPRSMEEKHEIIDTLVFKAKEYGLTNKNIIVDGLVATVGANKNAACETLETIRFCKDKLGIATVVGLSNISFGLPDRSTVNTAFLTLAIQAGLTLAIVNPMQNSLMKAMYATDLLLNKEGSDIRYIEAAAIAKVSENALKETTVVKIASEETLADDATVNKSVKSDRPKVYMDILKGNRNLVVEHVNEALGKGLTPDDVINTMLIPAINEVGELFEKQIYFLPQLISAAETMKAAIEYVEPMLVRSGDASCKVTVVMATVEGDIHDIGKNLVALMLKNYGYRVIDLGKNVSCKEIIDTAIREDAAVIGLSALMTTTMMEMKRVVAYAKHVGCKAKIIIGGAVVTSDFAREIGADGYSKDAACAVKLIESLLA